MLFRLEYGRTGLTVEVPDHLQPRVLKYGDCQPLADPERAVREALDQPQGTPPLAELARGRKDACILICDITRPVPNPLVLRPLLATLEAAGIARERILILVATGLHRPSRPEEVVEMVGEEIAGRYRIADHHGERLDEHTYLGQSPRGVPIWLDSRYVNAELKIAIGLIEPHFMAGFSGGRKLICPGIAAAETIRVWHGPRFIEHPRAESGMLDGNPIHEENSWIARRAGCDLIANVVIDDRRRPLKWVVGDLDAAFLAGVEFCRRVVIATTPEPADIVITCGAGYPLDTTFYQAVKGMVGALPVVKLGGTIILAASLSEGIGSSHFQQLFREHATLEAFMAKIEEPGYFVLDQWQLEELAKVRRHARVKVVSDGLPAETLNRLFVTAASSVEQALAESLAEYGPDAKVAVIPKGPYVLGRVVGGEKKG